LYGALMCVSPKHYENIASNMQELKRWVNQAQYLIKLYEDDRKDEIRKAKEWKPEQPEQD
jgi:hypothetical protein